MDEILYADFEIDGDDMFVVTPEGNKYTFPAGEYDESHDDVVIIDKTSHKRYTVRFDE